MVILVTIRNFVVQLIIYHSRLIFPPYQLYLSALFKLSFGYKCSLFAIFQKAFVLQVILNQIALAPVVLTFAFSWNLALTGQKNQIKGKLSRDLVPTMMNGKFLFLMLMLMLSDC